MPKFELGDILQDNVTGFKGACLARTEYFTECTHYGLQSQELKDGKPIEWEWFDETRLIKVEGAKPIFKEKRQPTSGPHPSAPSM